MAVETSIVVIDNSCLHAYLSLEARRAYDADCRAAGWSRCSSAINVLEAYKAPLPLRGKLLDVLDWFRGSRRLLPMPQEVMRATGEAIARGSSSARLPDSGLDYLLRWRELDEKAMEEAHRNAVELLQKEEDWFRGVHEQAWTDLKPARRQLSRRDRLVTAGEFLDTIWMSRDHIDDYLEAAWRMLDLPGAAPVEKLLLHPSWTLFLEGWGIAAYRQAYPANRKAHVGWADVMQLVYLGAVPRRLFLVCERALLEAASDVLSRRHPGTLVTSATGSRVARGGAAS